MKEIELVEESLEKFISYAKIKENPRVIIVDDVSEEELAEILIIVDRLRLLVFKVRNSNKLAFILNDYVTTHIAKKFNKRYQEMYQDYCRRPEVGSIVIACMTRR